MQRLLLLMLAGCGGRSVAEAPLAAASPDAAIPADAAPPDPVPPDAAPAVPLKLPVSGVPCFPDRASVPAQELQRGLRDGNSHDHRIGTCTYQQAGDPDAVYFAFRVVTAEGHAIADVHCGIDVSAPGFVDDHGHGVGTRGRTVLARHGRDAAARLFCRPDYEAPSRITCWMPVSEDDDSARLWSYVVAGDLAEPVSGQPAIALFAPQRVVELQYRGSCH